MLANHATRVLARRPGLRAKTWRPGRITKRQCALVDNLSCYKAGQRHLGGRNQPIALGRAKLILGKFRQLAGSEKRFVSDEQGRGHLEVAELGRMKIEHE